MIVGLCWPTPGAGPFWFDPERMALLREKTRVTHLRCDFYYRRGIEDCVKQVGDIRAGGFEVFPILTFDYDRPALGVYADFCREFCAATNTDLVELGNEPHTMGKMQATRYAQVFKYGAQAIRDAGLPQKVLIACEATKAITQPVSFFAQVSREVPAELYHGIAIHPYRNPRPPSYTKFGSREKEHAHYQKHAPGKLVYVTEDGWDLRDGVGEQEQADYLHEELSIQEGLGCEAVMIYAYTESASEPNFRFGVTDSNFVPRPACDAIRRFQEERGR